MDCYREKFFLCSTAQVGPTAFTPPFFWASLLSGLLCPSSSTCQRFSPALWVSFLFLFCLFSWEISNATPQVTASPRGDIQVGFFWGGSASPGNHTATHSMAESFAGGYFLSSSLETHTFCSAGLRECLPGLDQWQSCPTLVISAVCK